MKRGLLIGGLFFLLVAVFGWNPLYQGPNPSNAVTAGYSDLETGVRRLPNGIYEVTALTRMPRVKAHMIEWWIKDFLQTTEHYKWWHPTAHVWMDWENKTPGEIIGASHLVHEYIGTDLQELRIQFVPPREVIGDVPIGPGTFVLCARPGPLKEELYLGKMCHVVRDTEWGAEMRSRFWLGHIAARDGNEVKFSLVGLIGNTAIVRYFSITEQNAVDLMTHAIEEMGYLSDLLPDLYERETEFTPNNLDRE